jgi:hypothetical protein
MHTYIRLRFSIGVADIAFAFCHYPPFRKRVRLGTKSGLLDAGLLVYQDSFVVGCGNERLTHDDNVSRAFKIPSILFWFMLGSWVLGFFTFTLHCRSESSILGLCFCTYLWIYCGIIWVSDLAMVFANFHSQANGLDESQYEGLGGNNRGSPICAKPNPPSSMPSTAAASEAIELLEF